MSWENVNVCLTSGYGQPARGKEVDMVVCSELIDLMAGEAHHRKHADL